MEQQETKKETFLSPFEIRDDVHSGIWYTNRSKKTKHSKK